MSTMFLLHASYNSSTHAVNEQLSTFELCDWTHDHFIKKFVKEYQLEQETENLRKLTLCLVTALVKLKSYIAMAYYLV